MIKLFRRQLSLLPQFLVRCVKRILRSTFEGAELPFREKYADRGLPRPVLHSLAVASANEYSKHRCQSADTYARRHSLEQSLLRDGETSFETSGFCYVCGERSRFHSDLLYGGTFSGGLPLPNWRERVVCKRCGLNNRVRASIHLLEQIGTPAPDSRIYVTEQVTPLFKWLSVNYRQTIGSEYIGEAVPWGEKNSLGVRNESVTQLTFADESMDYILSFDVFEHVPDYLKAFRECVRCLRSGGMLLFTVPFRSDSVGHIERAFVTTDGQIVHRLPAEYHGDPFNAEGCLCFHHFGWALLDELRNIGFVRVAAHLYWSDELGYLGGEQIIFVGYKK